jgi:aldehyde:ferredoxin oxidoreductase
VLLRWSALGKLDLDTLVDYLQGVTRWDVSLWELCKAAERSFALFRIYNHREGRGTSEDRLPPRMFEPIQSGPLQGERLDPELFRQRLRDYYQLVGWDPQTGLPTAATLAELDIEWAAQYL